jgi:hypothetical protein
MGDETEWVYKDGCWKELPVTSTGPKVRIVAAARRSARPHSCLLCAAVLSWLCRPPQEPKTYFRDIWWYYANIIDYARVVSIRGPICAAIAHALRIGRPVSAAMARLLSIAAPGAAAVRLRDHPLRVARVVRRAADDVGAA